MISLQFQMHINLLKELHKVMWGLFFSLLRIKKSLSCNAYVEVLGIMVIVTLILFSNVLWSDKHMTVHACTLHGYVGAILGGAASCSLGTFPLSHDLTRREKLKSVWVKTGWEEQSAKEKKEEFEKREHKRTAKKNGGKWWKRFGFKTGTAVININNKTRSSDKSIFIKDLQLKHTCNRLGIS